MKSSDEGFRDCPSLIQQIKAQKTEKRKQPTCEESREIFSNNASLVNMGEFVLEELHRCGHSGETFTYSLPLTKQEPTLGIL